jgi:hypothetical protein
MSSSRGKVVKCGKNSPNVGETCNQKVSQESLPVFAGAELSQQFATFFFCENFPCADAYTPHMRFF